MRIVQNIRNVRDGYKRFCEQGLTPEKAYKAMIDLFLQTNGLSNDIFHRLTKPAQKKISKENLGQLVALQKDGVILIKDLVDRKTCEKLVTIFSNSPGLSKPNEPGASGKTFSQCKKEVNHFALHLSDVISLEEVQDILCHPKILDLAEGYLGSPLVLSTAQAWWSTCYGMSAESRSDNAQMFHFDMERIKWLKFFVYLNDVRVENGPHVFVLGTHKAGSQPKEFRNRGYARISDGDMKEAYPAKRICEFIGEAGTAILEDTRGYHKGSPPAQDARLILQVEYCTSLFGVNSRKEFPFLIKSNRLKTIVSQNPGFLKNYPNYRIA